MDVTAKMANLTRRQLFQRLGVASLAMGAGGRPARAADKKGRLRVGSLLYYSVGPVSLRLVRDNLLKEEAEKLGYDLDAQLKGYATGVAQIEDFAAGNLDVGYIGNVPQLRLIQTGQRVHPFLSDGGSLPIAVMVRPDSNIRSAQDLAGKKWAMVTAGDWVAFAIGFLEAQFGVTDPAKVGVTFVNVKSPASLAFPPQGTDVSLQSQPNLACAAQQDGSARILFDSNGITGAQYDGPEGRGAGRKLAALAKSRFGSEGFYLHRPLWVVRGEIAEKSPELVTAFAIAHHRALQRLVRMKPAEIVDYMGKEYWGENKACAETYVTQNLSMKRGWSWPVEGDIVAMYRTARILHEFGQLEKPVTWGEILKNIEPVAAPLKAAYEQVRHPEPMAFLDKSAGDVRGLPLWEYKKWAEPKA